MPTRAAPTISAATSRPAAGYLPTLDGWRALAIAAVLAYHYSAQRTGGPLNSFAHAYGSFGVDLFFAISGLLICTRLLEEERTRGRISLPNFYTRRTFRIMPPMIAYLASVAVLGRTHIIHVGRTAWLASLLFFNNYYSALRHDWAWSLYTNHFWSLAVEEHFYLLLPPLLVFSPRARAKKLAALTLAFLAWNLIFTARNHNDPTFNFSLNRTDLRIDALLFASLLAVLLQRPAFRASCLRLCNPWLVIPTVALACLAGYHLSFALLRSVIVPFAFPWLILSTMLHPHTPIGRLLESKPLRALGRISYSVYLWQQLFFPGEGPHAAGLLGRLQHGPWDILATLALAVLSYRLIEGPLIRLSHRLTPSTPASLKPPPARPAPAPCTAADTA